MLPSARDVASSVSLAPLLKGVVPPILEDKMLHGVKTHMDGDTLYIYAKVDPLWIELAETTVENLAEGISAAIQKMISSREGNNNGKQVKIVLEESKQEILGSFTIKTQ